MPDLIKDCANPMLVNYNDKSIFCLTYDEKDLDEDKNSYLTVQIYSRYSDKWELVKVKLPDNFHNQVKLITAVYYNSNLEEILLFANFYKNNENNEDESTFYNNMKNISSPGYINIQLTNINEEGNKFDFVVTMSEIKQIAFENKQKTRTKGFKLPCIKLENEEKNETSFKSLNLFLANDVVPHNSTYFYEYNNYLYYFTYNVSISLLELKSINIDYLE